MYSKKKVASVDRFEYRGLLRYPDNHSLPVAFKNEKYVFQTDSLLGLKTTDKTVDLTYNEIIRLHEEKYSEVKLTKCDWETGLMEKYKCRDGNSYKKSFYAVDIARTEHLRDFLLKSQLKKIAVVYGAGHFKFLYPDLIKAGFEYKNEKLNFN